MKLGNTDIEVSPLCFGTLTMTPFQANLSLREGADLLIHGFNRGINFLDTAEIYENYGYIREALKTIPREKIVIATKCYAYTEDGARKSLEKALRELNTDYVDIMLLHEQESEHTLRGHMPALKFFANCVKEGTIRATGVSTHFVACAKAAAEVPEIQVVHPIINMRGIGIQDGTVSDMLQAISVLYKKGKGIYSMKALGGGHLQQRALEALSFIRGIPEIQSTAVGMQSVEEVDFNCDFFFDGKVEETLRDQIKKKERRLIVADYCIGCGNCERRCVQGAIKVIDGRAVPNDKCILCGYCATVCPEFCIKVI